MSTAKYKALTPIEHDGKRYEEGDTLSLDEEQAAPLLALKAVEPGKPSRAPAPAPAPAPVDPQPPLV